MNFNSWNENYKKAKTIEQAHPFKNYAGTCNIEIFNFFNPEMQLKNTESAIKNKLKNFFNKLREF